MHKLARLSEDERRRLVNDFIDAMFGGLDADPTLVAMMRSAMPELPDDPEPDHVDAWVELAELTQDPDFRASMRRMAEYQAAERVHDTADRRHQDRPSMRCPPEVTGRCRRAGRRPCPRCRPRWRCESRGSPPTRVAGYRMSSRRSTAHGRCRLSRW